MSRRPTSRSNGLAARVARLPAAERGVGQTISGSDGEDSGNSSNSNGRRTDHGRGVRRRQAPLRFTCTVAALLLAAPPVATAQAARVWRIGYLTSEGVEPANPARVAFRQRLRELGYAEGHNVTLEMRTAEGRAERFPALAGDLVRLNVDVIVAGGDQATEAAQKATASIPIVMIAASDPVS